MSKYIGLSEEEKSNFISQPGTKVSSKLIFTSESADNDVTLFDAVNVNWKGYKIGDTELTYSGDIISYIANSYSYVLSNMVTSTDLPEFGSDTKIRTQISLYKTSNNQSSEEPPYVDNDNKGVVTYFNSGSEGNDYWATSKNNSHGGGQYVWMSSYYAVFKLNNDFIEWEGPASDPILLKGEKGDAGKPADYYEIRYGLFAANITPSAPGNNDITVDVDNDNITWHLVPQQNNDENLYTWTTQRLVICTLNGDNIVKNYSGDWSSPVRITGKNGVAQPVQPVLRYTWYNYYDNGTNYPSYISTNANPNYNGITWNESPGNPSGDNKYLWMIQGQRQNNTPQKIDETNYWTTPVCLSGKDGEPGADGDDIEFIYCTYATAHQFGDDNPTNWYSTESITQPIEEWTDPVNDNHQYAYVNDYLGPDGSGWTDQPQGVSSSQKYEYAAYRKTQKRGGQSYWEAFSTPFAWSIYGENGLDGDGVEYIYAMTADIEQGSEPTPPEFNLESDSFQHSEVYPNPWHDDPQQLNPNNNQLYQWVSKRNYRKLTQTNISQLPTGYTLNGDVLEYNGDPTNYKINDKIWFPYSNPELWNWWINDGTAAPQIVMIYKRTGSGTEYGNMPEANDGEPTTYAIPNNAGWTESPGNNNGSNSAYLWMTTNYYSDKSIDNEYTYYTVTSDWQTPMCLTGESGKDGEDGTDIEFIYLRTDEDTATPDKPFVNDITDEDFQKSDWPFVNSDDSEWTYITNGGIKFINGTYISGKPAEFDEGVNDDITYNVWTDNPLGITSTYDYEYASIRKKIDGEWQAFCEPFLWSKYGEDGLDGDGVEYIFYLNEGSNEKSFGINDANNPATWDMTSSDAQNSEYIYPSYKYDSQNPAFDKWSDDPRGISISNKYEYVSTRKKRTITELNKQRFISAWPNGDTEYTVGSGDNTHTYKIGDKVWFPYSEPTIWARYAEDGRAISLVLESNNDMTSISVNSEHIVNASVETDTVFSLYHNTALVDLTKGSYYKMEIFDSNVDTPDSYTIGWDDVNAYSYLKRNSDNYVLAKLKPISDPNSSNYMSYEMHISIPEGFDMTDINDELRIYSSAYITDPSFDIYGDVTEGTTKLITTKVKGLQLSLDDIFQIWTDRAVLMNDGAGNYPITTYLQSLTSNTKIEESTEQAAHHLYIIADNNDGNEALITVGDPHLTNVENSYTFRLYYNNGDNISTPADVKTNGVLLDEETVTLVTESEIYQLIVDPQVINYSMLNADTISCNVILYSGNIVTNITDSLSDYDLVIKYRAIPLSGATGNYEILSDGNSITVSSLDINVVETKGIEFALFKNNLLISSQTTVLMRNGVDASLPLTCELLNDNWQIAVLRDKVSVLRGNIQDSYLRIYYGTADITNSISNLRIRLNDQNNIPAFWVEEGNNKTITIENSPYGDDGVNISLNTNVESQITLSSPLESQQNIVLKVEFDYQSFHYTKYVNLSYVALPQDGIDGTTAELYDLFIEDDIIKQYVLADNIEYDPSTIQIKLRHVYGDSVEIINPSNPYKVYYNIDDGEWALTSAGVISLEQVMVNHEEINKITVALFNEDPNNDYSNYIDIETFKVVRDGINGTDSFNEEFIYYCPEGITEIDWTQISDSTLDPANWARSVEPDYIENNAWSDHPNGIDETHQYEYYAHRTWDVDNSIWNNYSHPVVWSNWGHDGKDGDGVEYIYRRTTEEIDFENEDEGMIPTIWCNDDDYQTIEYINNGYERNDYLYKCFTTEILDDGEITLHIGSNVNASCVSSISYCVKNDNIIVTDWVTPIVNDSSDLAITVSNLRRGYTVEWKANAVKYATNSNAPIIGDNSDPENVIVGNNSIFTSTCDFNVYGNIMSLFYGGNFINKKNWPTTEPNYRMPYLFMGNTHLISADNLILPALTLGSYDYYSLFKGCSNLTHGPQVMATTAGTSSFAYFFDGCSKLTHVYPIYCTNVANRAYQYFFRSCKKLTEIVWYPPYTSVDVGAVDPQPASTIYYQWVQFIGSEALGTKTMYYNPSIHNWSTVETEISAAPSGWDVTPLEIHNQGAWTDNPTGVDDENNYEYVSIRKYQLATIDKYNEILSNLYVDAVFEDDTMFNALLGDEYELSDFTADYPSTTLVAAINANDFVKNIIESIITNKNRIKAGKQIWMPYSMPTLWAKYGNDGGSTRTALIYTWNSNRASAPTVPQSGAIVSPWTEHPGNASGSNIYLWMSQGKEVDGEFVLWDTDGNPSTADAYWSAPVCLTGPDGATGSDGETMEFIYKSFDSEQTFGNDNNNPHNWTNAETGIRVTGINNVDPQQADYVGPSRYEWNDNPEGISEASQFEYCAIRYKNNGTWSTFDTPFLWSKWGEDGMDGDGVEYVFYDASPSEVNFTGSNYINSNNNPMQWCYDTNYQTPEYINPNANKWHDDPQNISSTNSYEYVSIRKFGAWTGFNYLEDRMENLPFKIHHYDTNEDEIVTFTNSDNHLQYVYSYILTDCPATTVDKTLGEYIISYAEIFHNSRTDDNPALIYQSSSYALAYTRAINSAVNGLAFSQLKYLSRNKETIAENKKLWLPYSKPSIWAKYGAKGDKGNDGSQGPQGFTGPIVRYCGEFSGTVGIKYYNGEVTSNYVESTNGLRYKDIVYYNGFYWTLKSHNSADNNWVTENNKYYIYGLLDTPHSGSDYWTQADQFDFVATKLLYADQALINQISSHDFIATRNDGYPVAGITTGKQDSGNPNTIYSLLNGSNPASGLDSGTNVDLGGNSDSAVRMFAGEIYSSSNNSYSLTYAPFNVRQDGTTYMSKANIIGDVNIGGNVTIGDKISEISQVKIYGDIAVNTLTLGDESFIYNENAELPTFEDDECKVMYVMYYNSSNRIITPDASSYIWSAASNDGLYTADEPGQGLELPDKKLYTLYSGKGTNPNNSIIQKFWLVTQSDLFIKQINTWSPPASITNVITSGIEVTNVQFTNFNDCVHNNKYMLIKLRLPSGCDMVTKDFSQYNPNYSSVEYQGAGDMATIDIQFKSQYNGHNIEIRTVDMYNYNVVETTNAVLGSNTVRLDKSDPTMWSSRYIGNIPTGNLSSFEPTLLNIYFEADQGSFLNTTWQIKGVNGGTTWENINQDALGVNIDNLLKDIIQVNSVSFTLYKV